MLIVTRGGRVFATHADHQEAEIAAHPGYAGLGIVSVPNGTPIERPADRRERPLVPAGAEVIRAEAE